MTKEMYEEFQLWYNLKWRRWEHVTECIMTARRFSNLNDAVFDFGHQLELLEFVVEHPYGPKRLHDLAVFIGRLKIGDNWKDEKRIRSEVLNFTERIKNYSDPQLTYMLDIVRYEWNLPEHTDWEENRDIWLAAYLRSELSYPSRVKTELQRVNLAFIVNLEQGMVASGQLNDMLTSLLTEIRQLVPRWFSSEEIDRLFCNSARFQNGQNMLPDYKSSGDVQLPLAPPPRKEEVKTGSRGKSQPPSARRDDGSRGSDRRSRRGNDYRDSYDPERRPRDRDRSRDRSGGGTRPQGSSKKGNRSQSSTARDVEYYGRITAQTEHYPEFGEEGHDEDWSASTLSTLPEMAEPQLLTPYNEGAFVPVPEMTGDLPTEDHHSLMVLQPVKRLSAKIINSLFILVFTQD
jgi:hypothetical protein